MSNSLYFFQTPFFSNHALILDFCLNKLVIVILYKTATNNSDNSSQTCSIDRGTHVFIPEDQSITQRAQNQEA